jgi:pyruvate dehydrogenase E2 component (dihydrolipoamide acetyltransferase)
MSEVNMPRLSDTMEEGTIARWLKKAGDEIKKGDILAEIETDKATMDLESYDAGVLEQILVQEGETAPIGQAVAIIGSGKDVNKGQAEQTAPTATRTADREEPRPQGAETNVEDTQAAPVAAGDRQPERTSSQGEQRAESPESSDGSLIKASPLARRMAQEHNIDLRQVHGTGPGGRIVRDDIEDILEQQRTTPAPAAAQPQVPSEESPVPSSTEVTAAPDEEVSTLSRVQMIIARRLTESKQTIPHFYVSSEVDMTGALAMRQVFNASAGEDGVKVSVNDLIVKACALALEKFPEVNTSFKDGQFVRHKHINVGIAVDIPAGLVVPVIRDANIKGVRSIARESKALIEKARANKLSTTDLDGGTFSVSNLGMMDVTDFIAVINPPQAGILAIASTRKHFVPVDGQPVIRDLMSMTMSADHRILYGATVARFLQEVKRLLQNPYSLLG